MNKREGKRGGATPTIRKSAKDGNKKWMFKKQLVTFLCKRLLMNL